MKNLSMYSGALDGFAMGFAWAGIPTIAHCESDAWRRDRLAEIYPQTRIYDYDTAVIGQEKADIITASPPCQPFSGGGLRRGAADPRHRWPVLKDLVGDVRPQYLVVENSATLTFRGVLQGEILIDLARMGYDAEWGTIPAWWYGLPHQRKRTFVVAYPTGSRREGVLCHYTPPGRKTGEDKQNLSLGDSRNFINWFREGMGEPAIFPSNDGLPYEHHTQWLAAIGAAVVPLITYDLAKCIQQHAALT